MNNNLSIAIKAALEAGEAIMEVYNSVIEVEFKDDKSPLTLADKRSNEIINTHLFPTQIPIISEENKQLDFSERKDWETCWIVDPVDGTKEFIKRNGEFTVNISLVKNGLPELGVIYIPAIKIIYFAEVSSRKSYKAILEPYTSELNEIFERAEQLDPGKSNDKLVRVVGSRSHMNQETLDFIESIKNQNIDVKIVSKGSSLKFCLIAEGEADVYPRYAPTMEWDTAAGQAICKAVGKEIINRDTGQQLRYNKENLLNPWFIVK